MEEELVINCISNQGIDWANIVMAIASVLNIIIVIYIFKKEQTNNKNKEIKDEKKTWYNLLGIQEMTTNFSNKVLVLKDKTFDFYSNNINQELYVNEYKIVEDELLKYKNEYITIVDCLNPELVNEITEEFQEIQDKLYDLMTKFVGDKNMNGNISNQEINISFDDIRKQIIKMSIRII